MRNVLTANNSANTHTRINPLKFALWLGMASILMMFAALTSAYLVRRAGGNWLEFSVPTIFYYSTLVLLFSSLCLHLGYSGYKKRNMLMYQGGVISAFVLGCIFLALQYQGWVELFSFGIDLKGNPSGSFLYVITGIHGLHILGGLAALVVGIINAFTLKKFTKKRKVNIEITLQYWHFVDILWVYLLIFLIMSR
ncbi:MAG: cytochrome c oxidase subunit 3 [Saprospiraceae bacterium]